jgi:large subunit ribosomal protein L17
MMANMATSLIMHKRISTTLAKAKELRKFVEPIVTRSKNDTTHSRRMVFSQLRNKYAVTELFREISQKIATRPGGYTRILKTGFRKGDNAEMCIIEFVDYNETYTTEGGKKKSTRTRRSSKKAVKTEEVVAEAAAETVAEEPKAE